MKKIILICLFMFAMLSFSAPERDNRGVLVMEPDEWFQMFGDNAKTNGRCSFIGASIMQLAYTSEGKMKSPLEEVFNNLSAVNAMLYDEGLRHPSGDNSLLFEYYYFNNCRKLTDKDFNLVASPSFKKVFSEIYSTYK